jgi:DNA uptake protein ComE-like DNA-binding protein
MNKRFIENTVKDFLSFSKGERNGIIILFFLILALSIFRFTYPFKNKRIKEVGLQKSELQKAQPSLLFCKSDTSFHYTGKKSYRKAFSPGSNQVSFSQKIKIIEINTVDSIQLDSLPGIGPVLSRRIIKYRELLGGFYTKNQLLEVFGIKPDQFNKFEKYIYVDTSKVKKININFDTFKKINAHPYITYEQAKTIFKHRNKGVIIDQNILSDNFIFDSVEIKKVLHYLIF